MTKAHVMAQTTRQMRQIEQKRGKPIEEIVEEVLEKHVTLRDVAAELGISRNTLCVWRMWFGFEPRQVKPESAEEV